MKIQALILKYAQPELEAKDANAILSVLNASTQAVVNDERWNYADIASIIGAEATNRVGVEIAVIAPYPWITKQLAGEGIRFNDDDAWLVLQGLISRVSEAQQIADKIRSTTTPSQLERGIDATLEEIQQVVLKVRKDELIGLAQDRLTDYNVAVSNWDGTDPAPEL